MLHSWVQPGHTTPAAAAAAGRGRGCIGSRRLLMLDHDDDARQGRLLVADSLFRYKARWR